MENPKDETERDDLAPPAEDEDVQEPEGSDPAPVPPAAAPKKPKDDAEEDSYEDGWYQVLKRRSVGSGDHED
jgi:hypothetical protein